MNKETKLHIIEALKKCEEHWLWTADKPGRHKRDYPPAKDWIDSCALCDIAISCETCNDLMKWSGDNNHCCSKISNYVQYLRLLLSDYLHEATVHARKIALKARKARKRLENEI